LEEGDIGRAELHVLKRFPLHIRVISFAVNLLLYVIQIRNLVRKNKPDILHAHYVTDCGFLGALSGFHPLVLTAWGSDIQIDPKRNPLVKTLTKYALKKADLVTCDGEHIMPKTSELGADPRKIKVINFGVDTKKFSPRQSDERLRQELRISDSPAIISLRGLKPLYDVESLVNAIPLVLERVPKAKFVIAGDGPQRGYLKRLANSLDISDSVKFIGSIPNNELPKYLASMDIYVSTSLSDAGLAASTAEAMACGLPVIITDFGDNRKWVQDAVNGYIIPLRNPEILASRIICLLHDEEARKKFGRTNRQIIEERNDWEKEMQRMEKLYEELIGRFKE
jgi:glycosyltransferase involved in cell wall biosynthesis